MKRWRPTGWKRFKTTIRNVHNTPSDHYEAGANAMLIAIQKLGVREATLNPLSGTYRPGRRVWIPDKPDKGAGNE